MTMLILGIESATGRVGCSLTSDDGAKATVQAVRRRQHAELLSWQIQAVCHAAGKSLRQVTAVAVDVGPGLYTGLRVGVTTAITIAHALGVPVVALNSLEILSYKLRHCNRRITAVLDARRGEVFHAQYRGDGFVLRCVREPAVDKPETVAALVAGSSEPTIIAGDGAVAYRSLFGSLEHVWFAGKGDAYPCAEALGLLARRHIADPQRLLRPEEVRPCYLRSPDARPLTQAAPQAT